MADFRSRKGSAPHRGLGFVYLALMTVTAVTRFWIRSIADGALSPMRLFIPLTPWGVYARLLFWRLDDRRSADLLPGRLVHRAFFG